MSNGFDRRWRVYRRTLLWTTIGALVTQFAFGLLLVAVIRLLHCHTWVKVLAVLPVLPVVFSIQQRFDRIERRARGRLLGVWR